MSTWLLLIIGFVLIGIAYLFAISSSDFIIPVIIGGIGMFLLFVVFDRSRILFNRWQNR